MIVDACVRHVAVTAVRWTDDRDSGEVQRLVGMVGYKRDTLEIPSVGRLTLSGVTRDHQTVRPGDWIVKIEEGLFLLCEPALFERLFEVRT